MSYASPIIYSFNQTADGNFNSDVFSVEVSQSTISVPLSYINTGNRTIYLYFTADISNTDKATLDSLISHHSGIAFNFAANYKEIETDLTGKIVREAYYSLLAADGTLRYKTEETTSTYSILGALTSQTVNKYYLAGDVSSTKTYNYTSSRANGTNTIKRYTGA